MSAGDEVGDQGSGGQGLVVRMGVHEQDAAASGEGMRGGSSVRSHATGAPAAAGKGSTA